MNGREAFEELKKLEKEGRLDEAVHVNIVMAADIPDYFDTYIIPPTNQKANDVLKRLYKSYDELEDCCENAWYEVQDTFYNYIAQYFSNRLLAHCSKDSNPWDRDKWMADLTKDKCLGEPFDDEVK